MAAPSEESTASSSSLQRRLQQLEQPLLYDPNPDATSQIESRLRALEQQCAALPHSTLLLPSASDNDDIKALFDELSPGTALTHQRHIVAPLVYRRQVVLAAAETYQRDLRLLLEMQHLLLLGASSLTNERTEEAILLQAPILQGPENDKDDDDASQRNLYQSLVQLQGRIERASQKFDHLLEHYQTLILATSEKLVAITEEHDHVVVQK